MKLSELPVSTRHSRNIDLFTHTFTVDAARDGTDEARMDDNVGVYCNAFENDLFALVFWFWN